MEETIGDAWWPSAWRCPSAFACASQKSKREHRPTKIAKSKLAFWHLNHLDKRCLNPKTLNSSLLINKPPYSFQTFASRHVLYFVAPPARLQPGQFDLMREVLGSVALIHRWLVDLFHWVCSWTLTVAVFLRWRRDHKEMPLSRQVFHQWNRPHLLLRPAWLLVLFNKAGFVLNIKSLSDFTYTTWHKQNCTHSSVRTCPTAAYHHTTMLSWRYLAAFLELPSPRSKYNSTRHIICTDGQQRSHTLPFKLPSYPGEANPGMSAEEIAMQAGPWVHGVPRSFLDREAREHETLGHVRAQMPSQTWLSQACWTHVVLQAADIALVAPHSFQVQYLDRLFDYFQSYTQRDCDALKSAARIGKSHGNS